MLGYFGDPFGVPHGQCQPCTCYPRGTEQTDDGINQCDQTAGISDIIWIKKKKIILL